MMLSGTILVALYVAMIVRNCLGVKYKWITLIMVLLLVSNCSTMYLAFNNYLLIIKNTDNMFLVVLLGLVQGLQDGSFSVALQKLAEKFKTVVKEVPMMMEEQSLEQAQID